MDKRLLRNNMLDVLNRMGEMDYNQLSKRITDQIIVSDEFKKAKTIGVTISRFPEVNIYPLLEAAWKMNKRVAVPKCISATKEMDFRQITSLDNLEVVYHNLFEPIIADTDAIAKDEMELLIVPGVVFSNDGYRIGFGGGYYDRYLKNFRGATLSLAFDNQFGHKIPIESHDIPVHKIFTEKRQITCQMSENQ